MPSTPFGEVSHLVVLSSRIGKPSVQVSSAWVLAVTSTPSSRYVDVPLAAVLASTHKDHIMTQVSEAVVLVSFVEGGTERFDTRAWGFNLDQHQFYVLHLGVEGTWVYDVLSEEWSQWQTQGFATWNAENGVEWNDQIFFGDNSGSTLWRLDPYSFLDDDFRLIKRVVTGGIPAESRNTIRTGMFVLSATREGSLDDESTPYVQLSLSDDEGNTFRDREALTIDSDQNTQDFSWRSLGTIKAPGRVFKITDEGGFVTIKGANQKVDGETDKG